MAIDPNPNRSPGKFRPAREHAPAGTVNTSRPESGGQELSAPEVAQTPSMGEKTKPTPSTAQPRPHRASDGAVSD